MTRDLQHGLGSLGAGAGPKTIAQQRVDVDTVGHVCGRDVTSREDPLVVRARNVVTRGWACVR